jgi:hypothetical protein
LIPRPPARRRRPGCSGDRVDDHRVAAQPDGRGEVAQQDAERHEAGLPARDGEVTGEHRAAQRARGRDAAAGRAAHLAHRVGEALSQVERERVEDGARGDRRVGRDARPGDPFQGEVDGDRALGAERARPPRSPSAVPLSRPSA